MLGGWAYGAIYQLSDERTPALPGWLDFYNHRDPTAPSATNHRYGGWRHSGGTTFLGPTASALRLVRKCSQRAHPVPMSPS